MKEFQSCNYCIHAQYTIVEIIIVSVAKVGALSLFISAIVEIDVVLFALVVATTRATYAKEGRGLLWGLWTTSLSK
jgi:uncharacterized membrane protein YdbT with pleckstrin-like domain